VGNWSILRPFDIFYVVVWYIFPRFGMYVHASKRVAKIIVS
jgi:hypothetical protein